MTGPRIGSLFSGYGGLDMGVQAVIGGHVMWHVEYDQAPSRILEHHWPTVPNYGDVTTVDWAAVEPVDAITAGYPCQPFSIAGKRKGSNDERHLWPYVLTAIRHLRPRIVILENVRGHLSMGFDRVLGDLAEAGYDTQWICLPAAHAGAPHRRERIFIVAHPAGVGSPTPAGTASPDADDEGRELLGRLESEQRDTDRRSSADQSWGKFEPAIRRWEHTIRRHAPAPTLPDGRGGNHRLNSAFVEWMMGLPAGHVTGVGLKRNEELKALGNGVVPQQAALAIRTLLGVAA